MSLFVRRTLLEPPPAIVPYRPAPSPPPAPPPPPAPASPEPELPSVETDPAYCAPVWDPGIQVPVWNHESASEPVELLLVRDAGSPRVVVERAAAADEAGRKSA